jgi:hypothetical protein
VLGLDFWWTTLQAVFSELEMGPCLTLCETHSTIEFHIHVINREVVAMSVKQPITNLLKWNIEVSSWKQGEAR